MEVVFSSKKVEKQCTDLTAAKKLVGGDDAVARGLLARINMFKQAVTIKDIIVQKQLHFHKLNDRGRKKLDGYFAIDVKRRAQPVAFDNPAIGRRGQSFYTVQHR